MRLLGVSLLLPYRKCVPNFSVDTRGTEQGRTASLFLARRVRTFRYFWSKVPSRDVGPGPSISRMPHGDLGWTLEVQGKNNALRNRFLTEPIFGKPP